MTLYCPHGFLRDGENSIVVLDIDPVGTPKSISLTEEHILEGESAELD